MDKKAEAIVSYARPIMKDGRAITPVQIISADKDTVQSHISRIMHRAGVDGADSEFYNPVKCARGWYSRGYVSHPLKEDV